MLDGLRHLTEDDIFPFSFEGEDENVSFASNVLASEV